MQVSVWMVSDGVGEQLWEFISFSYIAIYEIFCIGFINTLRLL